MSTEPSLLPERATSASFGPPGMSRHLLQRFVVWAAFAVALLIPLSARAAILPLCEVDAMTMTPRAPLTLLEAKAAALPFAFAAAEEVASPCGELAVGTTGAAATADDADAVDPKIAAFCDARGASAVAPQRILPINDARIDAPSSCAHLDTSTPTIWSSPRDGLTAGLAALLLDPASVDASAMVYPASSSLLPAYAPVTGAEHAGVLRSIDHPPR